MSKCPNCNISLGCSCQKRTFPNGTQGCTNCINKPVKPITTPK